MARSQLPARHGTYAHLGRAEGVGQPVSRWPSMFPEPRDDEIGYTNEKLAEWHRKRR